MPRIASAKQDKLAKVRPLIAVLVPKFLDESMLKFKGRLSYCNSARHKIRSRWLTPCQQRALYICYGCTTLNKVTIVTNAKC